MSAQASDRTSTLLFQLRILHENRKKEAEVIIVRSLSHSMHIVPSCHTAPVVLCAFSGQIFAGFETVDEAMLLPDEKICW